MCLCVKILDLFIYSTIMLLLVLCCVLCGIRNPSTTVREQAPYNNQFLPRTKKKKNYPKKLKYYRRRTKITKNKIKI